MDRDGEVADGAADAHQARSGAREPLGALQLGGDMLAQLLDLPALGGPVGRQESLGHAHRAQPPGAELARHPVGDSHQLQRAAAEVQHTAIHQGRGVDRRQIPIARLLLAAEHADRQARALVRKRQEVSGVLGVANRAGGEGVHGVTAEARRPAEVVEHIERGQRAAHRLLPQSARRGEALADAHRLVDLVGAPPPSIPRHEHDEPEGVGAEVDHGQAFAHARHGSGTAIIH